MTQQFTIIVTESTIRISPEIAGVEIAADMRDGEWVVRDGYNTQHVIDRNDTVAEIEAAIGYYAEDDYEVSYVYHFGHGVSVGRADGQWVRSSPGDKAFYATFEDAERSARYAVASISEQVAEAKAFSDYLDSDEAKREAQEWDNLPEWGDVPGIDQ